MATRPEVNFIDPSLAELETSIAKSLESETSSMTTTPKREIAFIDRGVDDLATLLAGIRPDVEPILLSNDEPAPRQMARAVQGREGLEAIHVIAHGRPGEVSFGAGALSVETIAEHSDDLAQVGLALGDGELRLWTCQTAGGERGAAFADALARMAGVQVAASTQLVGAAARGGQWALDGGSGNAVPLSAEGAAVYPSVMTTSTTVNDNNTSTDYTISTTTANATINLNNSSGDDSVTTDGSGSTTVNANNSTGDDAIDIVNASAVTVNLNNSTGNDDVDITGTTVNATVNDNNSGVTGGVDEIDITGTAVTATVNLNNSLGNDNVNIVGTSSTNATVNLNNSGGKDTINVGSTTGATTATINLNSSGGTDIVNVTGANTTATVNLANSTGVGDFVELVGKGTGTINAVNSTGNDTLIGANSTDTITGGTGNDTVDLKGGGTINAGSGNDLGIYTLSDHYSLSGSTLTSINGDVDYYYGQGGTNTLDIVLTAAQWSLPKVQSDLANYAAFLATNPGPNQTFTFHFGATSGALTVAGWQDLNVQIAGQALLAATGVEDSPTALSVATAVAGFPGGSLQTLTIGSIPAGAALSNTHGDPLTISGGSITFTSAQLASGVLIGLALTPPPEFEGSITLTLTATKAEGSGSVTTIASETVTVNPFPETPVLAGSDAVAASSSVNEGGTVGLTIAPTFESDPDATNTVTITGVPTTATLTNSLGQTFNGGSTITLSQAQLAGLTLHAPDSDLASISLTVQAHASEGAQTANSVAQTINVTINPVPETPTLTAPATASGNEDAPIALNITDVLSEIDGDASLTNVTITGVPAGVSFSAGTLVGGTLTLSPGQLSGLTLTSDGEVQNFSLHVVAGTTDAGSPAANASTDIAVTVTPVADAPTLTAPATASGNEDAPIALNITDVLSEIDGDASLTNVTITGVPAGVSFSAGTLVGGTLTLSPGQLSGLTLTSDGEVQNFSLHVVAGTTDAGSPAANASTDIAVTVTPVADAPTLTAPATASGNEDAPIALNITDVLSEIDGDASLTNVTITGVPAGVSFSAGTLVGGTLTLSPGQLSGLTLTSDGEVQNFSLHVVAGTTDAGSPAANASTDIAVTVTPVADAPTLTAPATASGNEDAPIALNITDVLSEIDGDASLTNVTITGVPAGVSFSAGTLVGGTLTLSPGQLSGLTLTSDGEVQNFSLHVVAGTTDAGSPAANASTDIAVTVTPVADAPTLTAPATASGNEDAPIALNITDVLSEIDGDASLTNVTITGVPAGVSFSAGTLVGGTLTLSPGQLSGLTLTSDGEVQNFSLHVVAGTTDAGSPAANASTDIAVTVTPVADAPTLTAPATASGNEDAPIALNITDVLSEIDGDASLTNVTITGVPAGVSFSAGTLVGGTLTLSPGQLSGLTLTSDGEVQNFSLHVVAGTTDAGSPAANASTDIAVTVTPVADAPTLTAPATASGNEDAPIALNITDVLSEIDGDASLTNVTITGVPAGVSFSAGTLVGGTLTLSPGQLSGLTLTSDGEVQNFSLHVVAGTTDAGSPAANASTDIAVTVTPVADAPTLTAPATASGNEDAPIALNITDVLSEIDGDASLTNVTITGVPAGVSFSAGTLVGGTLTLSPGQLSGLTLTSDGEVQNFSLHVVAGTTDAGSPAANASTDIAVTVTPVADAPTLTGTQTAVTVNENGSAALSIVDALTESQAIDPDSSLGMITISGIPTGVTFNKGSVGVGNTWTLNPATDLTNLQINVSEDQPNFTLTVVATTSDGGSIASSTPTNIAITVNSAAENPSLGKGNPTIAVTENAATALGLTLSAFDTDDSLSVTITGVPAGSTFNAGTLSGSTLTISQAQPDHAGWACKPQDHHGGCRRHLGHYRDQFGRRLCEREPDRQRDAGARRQQRSAWSADGDRRRRQGDHRHLDQRSGCDRQPHYHAQRAARHAERSHQCVRWSDRERHFRQRYRHDHLDRDCGADRQHSRRGKRAGLPDDG